MNQRKTHITLSFQEGSEGSLDSQIAEIVPQTYIRYRKVGCLSFFYKYHLHVHVQNQRYLHKTLFRRSHLWFNKTNSLLCHKKPAEIPIHKRRLIPSIIPWCQFHNLTLISAGILHLFISYLAHIMPVAYSLPFWLSLFVSSFSLFIE